MKKLLTVIAIMALCITLNAQSAKNSLEKRISEIEDRFAIKNLTDSFAILADQKDAQKQTLLFTENAVVEIYNSGKLTLKLDGRKQIGETFGRVLNSNEILYHFNGQNTITLNGDKAEGTVYCITYLINTVEGEKIKTTMAIHYKDEYVRENGKWFISKRTSTFDWAERNTLGQ